MKEDLISFETAKLAKEKGFDIPVFYFIKDCGEGLGIISHLECEIIESCEFNEILENHNLKKEENIWSQPTQSLLQKWLREKHNIHVYVVTSFYNRSELLGYIYCIDIFDSNNIHFGIERDEEQRVLLGVAISFNSYEEALEIGLQEALKLIK